MRRKKHVKDARPANKRANACLFACKCEYCIRGLTARTDANNSFALRCGCIADQLIREEKE